MDSSGLVKRYVAELGASETDQALVSASRVGTSEISRVEVVAALGKSVRMGTAMRKDAEFARALFRVEWPHFERLSLNEQVMERACDLSWLHRLRGYDSVQLATALAWQEYLDAPLTMVSFDLRLWEAAARVGLEAYPENLPELFEAWRVSSLPTLS